MPEESIEGAGDRHHNDARREARRRESRWWKGSLLATLMFVGLATLYNGIAYRRLVRAQQRLTIALIHQARQNRFVPMGSVFVPLPGAPDYAAPGRGWQPYYPPADQQKVPDGQATPVR